LSVELLNFAVELSRQAGAITLEYFLRDPEISTKADGSFVTIADRNAERFMREQIRATFPEDGIVGEEEGDVTGSSGRRWILDPIDGTFAFVHGVPFYGVLIGLEVDDKMSLGVVNIPALNEVVYAAIGMGCFWNGKPTRVSDTNRLDDALVLCTDFMACRRYGFEAATERVTSRAKTNRTWGDCYGYVLVATGRADVMLDPVMNLWDCAALKPILEEAGGTFTDWTGSATASGGNAIATNGKLFEEVMTLVTGRDL